MDVLTESSCLHGTGSLACGSDADRIGLELQHLFKKYNFPGQERPFCGGLSSSHHKWPSVWVSGFKIPASFVMRGKAVFPSQLVMVGEELVTCTVK